MAYTVQASARTDTGKGKVRKIRRDGMLPAVMYGHGDPSVMLALPTHDFDRLLAEMKGHSPIVEVNVAGKQQLCIIKTLQRNPIDGSLLHVDFQKVHPGEKITMNVPVIVTGMAEGIKQGGMVDHILRHVPTRTTIDKIPERFEIDVTPLKMGHSIHIADLGRADLEFALPSDSPIVTCLIPRKLTEAPTAEQAAAAAEAGPAEPEVLKEKKPAEGEEGAEEETKGKAKGGKEEKREAKPAKEEKKEAKKK